MHYTIISCSPQNKARSSSACIASWLRETLVDTDELSEQNEAVIFYLNERTKWDACADRFYKSENTIFIIPLYVEGIPGILLEFLESLDTDRKQEGFISFVLQGGFEEASQLRTAEKYLQTLPGYFQCQYGGTLLKGGMFGMATMRGERFKQKMKESYTEAFKTYKINNSFDKSITKKFAGVEYYSKGMLHLAKLSKPLNRLVWSHMAKKMGSTAPIKSRPYEY